MKYRRRPRVDRAIKDKYAYRWLSTDMSLDEVADEYERDMGYRNRGAIWRWANEYEQLYGEVAEYAEA